MTAVSHHQAGAMELFPLPAPVPVQRSRDSIWDLLEELFGPARTTSERGRRNSVVKQLKAAEATVDEIKTTYHYCSERYDRFSDAALTTNLSAALLELARRGTVAVSSYRSAGGSASDAYRVAAEEVALIRAEQAARA